MLLYNWDIGYAAWHSASGLVGEPLYKIFSLALLVYSYQ